MDSKDVYETCGAIAAALPTRPRSEFAAMIHRYVIGADPVPNRFRRIRDALDGKTSQDMLAPLVGLLRTNNDTARRAAHRWLRDAGWLS
jgi:hypothetical protein